LTIGHRPIAPRTRLVGYPSAARWLSSRLHLVTPRRGPDSAVLPGFEDYLPIERFGPDFAAFFERVARRFPAIFVRDAAYMSWRYVDIPHRRYLRRERLIDGRTSAVVVIAIERDQASIVDLLWDPERADEPDRTVRFARALCDEHRASRVTCFATHPALRAALSRAGFIDRGETPRFSAFVPEGHQAAFAEAGALHVVDGDGDTEFS
jgi:hypothetical protein